MPLVEIPTNPTQAPFLDFFDQTNRPTLDDPRVSAPTDSPGRPLWTNPFGPAALDNLVFYVVESDASFSCALAGSRCAFLRSDFEDIDEEGGAIADQREGTVWTVGTLKYETKIVRRTQGLTAILLQYQLNLRLIS